MHRKATRSAAQAHARLGRRLRLHRRLGLIHQPRQKFLPNSGVAGTALAMALGLLLVMIIIAFSYAYMVPKYPQAGGEFTFTKMCFGKRAAYVCGWFLRRGVPDERAHELNGHRCRRRADGSADT